MNLVNTREGWKKAFEDGFRPMLLDKYVKHRGSEEWRSSSTTEQLCEYILYLEDK